jgi:hypothetical protein
MRSRSREVAADAERHRAVLERVQVHGHIPAEPGTWKLRQIESPAQREVRIRRKPGDRAMQIDDEAGNGRRRLLGVSRMCTAEDNGEHAKNYEGSQRSVNCTSAHWSRKSG